jgi:hypothetical protein
MAASADPGHGRPGAVCCGDNHGIRIPGSTAPHGSGASIHHQAISTSPRHGAFEVPVARPAEIRPRGVVAAVRVVGTTAKGSRQVRSPSNVCWRQPRLRRTRDPRRSSARSTEHDACGAVGKTPGVSEGSAQPARSTSCRRQCRTKHRTWFGAGRRYQPVSLFRVTHTTAVTIGWSIPGGPVPTRAAVAASEETGTGSSAVHGSVAGVDRDTNAIVRPSVRRRSGGGWPTDQQGRSHTTTMPTMVRPPRKIVVQCCTIHT